MEIALDLLARDGRGDEEHEPHRRRGEPDGEVHRHDDREVDGVNAELDEDRPEDRPEDDDRRPRVEEHADDEEQQVDEEEERERVFRKPQDELASSISRRVGEGDDRLERDRRPDEEEQPQPRPCALRASTPDRSANLIERRTKKLTRRA